MAAPDLPEPLIHRIQSFLTAQKAAETAAISKSWLHAWSTRPTIDIDCSLFTSDYSYYPQIDELTAFATETFRRYEDLGLTINAFSLCLTRRIDSLSDLATEWTKRALKLGASDFTFESDYALDISLPIRLVLGSDYPIRILRLERTSLDRILEESIGCSGLKSLDLSYMEFSIDSLFRLISCLPLIEHLSLDNVLGYDPAGSSIISLPRLTSLTLSGLLNSVLQSFEKLLSSLSLFPNLKELTLSVFFIDHDRDEVIKIPAISSGSLEIFNLTIKRIGEYGYPRAELEIDAPMIRRFTFDSCILPNFSFRSKSREQLECRVTLSFSYLSASWLCALREFLTSMAGSRISLCLKLVAYSSFDYVPGDVEFLILCELEDLIMDAVCLPSMSFYAVLDALFRICRPKTITQYVISPEDGYMFDDEDLETIRKNDVILCRVLEQGMQGKFGLPQLPSQYMYGLCELEEVNAQKLCDDHVLWMPQSLDSVLDSISDDRQNRFRFQMKWKSLA